MGRHKGSKNKTNLSSEALKIKEGNKLPFNIKEVKREIRKLRKLKLACRSGTEERILLGRQIKDLQAKLTTQTTPEPEKQPIITEILKIELEKKIIPTFQELEIDLNKYTLVQLQFHLNQLKNKYNKKEE